MESNSIKEYLLRIKDDIDAVENGSRELNLFAEIESDFYQMLELIKLFMISERDSYYGYFMMNLSYHADFCSNCIAGIRLNTYPPVMDSNPLLLCKYSLKEIIFIICHEIEHIILGHPAEMVKSNPTGDPEIFERFNIAADASVNDRLRYEIENENRAFMTIPDRCILSETLMKMFRLMRVRPLENYQYYYNLIKNKNTSDDENDISGSEHSQANGNNNNSEQPDSTGTHDDENEDQIITSQNCGKSDDHNWQAGDDADEIVSLIREFINESTEMMDEETRGLMPAHYLEQVKKINEPPIISWQRVLKKYIGIISAGKRKTRMRLNRRQPSRYDLSGEMNDRMLKIVVAIDTSGSVSNREIAQIFNEIFAILAKRKYCITVIECDSEIQRIYLIHNPSDVKLDVAGRGGTAFTPVIEHINSDRYYRDALLIYFTDGYGEDRIPRPMTYRNIWVITGRSEELSLKNPYGAVISFEEGENA
ncbi:MAG: VWA-like domain-containing protein [Oscillospiraceae bacterium]